MVIGNDFAWAHLPKAAGDTTHAMFSAVPRLIEYADSPDTNEKHAVFSARQERIEGKALLLNLRRLPAWTLSYCQYTAQHGLYPDFVPTPMKSPVEMAESGLGDQHLSWYTASGELSIAFWIRAEHLTDDFVMAMTRFADLTSEEAEAVRAVDAQNTRSYDKHLASWFTPEHVQLMYRSNPTWAEVEQAIYGDLLAL